MIKIEMKDKIVSTNVFYASLMSSMPMDVGGASGDAMTWHRSPMEINTTQRIGLLESSSCTFSP
jgi:hypothetical protein